MIIAGAGGHALEVLDILIQSGHDSPAVYGEEISHFWPDHLPAMSTWEEVSAYLAQDPAFVLGLGSPYFRKRLYEEFCYRGGMLQVLRGIHAVISPSAQATQADVLTDAFVGAQVKLGLGVLVNAGAQVHHEVQVGDFTVVNPRAVLLGACQIGTGCAIGAQATVLPGVKVGDGVVIGAGTVVIRDVPADVTVVGVPGRIVPKGSKI